MMVVLENGFLIQDRLCEQSNGQSNGQKETRK